MASNKFVVSEFDFDTIKQNLKNYLQNQPEFSDYDFEGSGFAVLLDILAYNTHYLGFNANMLANEMYLDSADIRKNIVSLSKMLGYTPASVRTPRAEIDLTVNNVSSNLLTMTKGTVFTSQVDGVSYQFVTNRDITITSTDGVYNFSNVDLYEGTLITFKYTVDSSDTDQRFTIPSVNADTSTLRVTVQNSLTDTTTNVYTLAAGLREINSNSKIYFLQETDTGKFEIYFGDGVFGKKLDDGNIIIIDYIVTNKTEANGASSFTLSSTIEGNSDVIITTKSIAQGGSEAEKKESIRYNAPLQYAAQDRAVTTTDYETIVRNLYPNALSVSAWGGEEDETPQYGVVNISIKPNSGSSLTNQTKGEIINSLKKYNIASVRPVITDTETTFVELISTVRYDQNNTSKLASTLRSEILSAITNYNTNILQRFDGVFRFSKLTGIIDNVDNSIISNITTVKVRKSFAPLFNTSTRYDIYFRNSFYNPHPGHSSMMGGILKSTGFTIDGDTNEMFLDDDGNGNIRRFFLNIGGVKTYVNENQGVINYTTGQITLDSLNVTSIPNIRGTSSENIELTVVPNSYDIIPVRNTIIEIDIPNISLTVENDTFAAGSADAGVGYTTPTSYSA
jgi:hypothetical protein